ncbi:MAG TPA: tail fiber domain-containing protein [Saprospiraceae bacterium]|nr:tail fiber domain-containing protein [Saprospiraceae bacterium]
MKITKAYFCLSLLLTIGFFKILAQAPDGFKYQGVARDANGAVYASETIQLQFLILEETDSTAPLSIYEEQHSVTTSPQGVFSITIGEGTPLAGLFTAIDWANHPYSLQVKLRPATEDNFIDLGKTRLLSVPYALHANTVSDKDDDDADPSNELQQLRLNGNELSLSPGGGAVKLEGMGNSPWLEAGPDTDNGIYYNGKVGINNSNPRAALSIGSNFNDSLWTFPAVTIGGTGAEGGALEMGNDQKKLRIYTSNDLDNRIEANENNMAGALNILAKQVNIGKSAATRDQHYPLAVQVNVSDGRGFLLESGFNNHLWEFYPNSATDQLFLLYNGDAIGYWNPNTGIYTAGVSDKRRKENIRPLPAVAKWYQGLNVHQYNYQNRSEESYTGFLAQELQKVFPNTVSSIQMDGQEEAVLVVDYDQITALNAAAIKEQQAYIEKLEEKLAAQEERLAKLEALLNKE